MISNQALYDEACACIKADAPSKELAEMFYNMVRARVGSKWLGRLTYAEPMIIAVTNEMVNDFRSFDPETTDKAFAYYMSMIERKLHAYVTSNK